MFRSIVVSPDKALGNRLVLELEATGHVAVTKHLDSYRTPADLVRTLRAHAAEILFLSFESSARAIEIVHALEAENTPVQVVGFHKSTDPRILRDSMRAGVREFLAEPFERSTVLESLACLKALLARHPADYSATDQIFTFLPSKAGVGTSTIALNVAAAMARAADTRVLLADFDLNSGMQRFMLKLANEFSVSDALEHAAKMDENLWPSLVTDIEGMDVLHAGRVNPNLQIETTQIRNLVAFARRHYQALCFDLSGNLEKYSVELMQESRRILLVCTPEIPSLHLAREKLAFLKEQDLDHRVSVVLTRAHRKGLFTQAQVEELVGVPVIQVVSNDYQAIHHSVSAGIPLSKGSELGKGFTAFAQALMAPKIEPSAEPTGRKFLEFVAASVAFPVPGRD